MLIKHFYISSMCQITELGGCVCPYHHILQENLTISKGHGIKYTQILVFSNCFLKQAMY